LLREYGLIPYQYIPDILENRFANELKDFTDIHDLKVGNEYTNAALPPFIGPT